MKKTIVVILAGILMFSMSACSTLFGEPDYGEPVEVINYADTYDENGRLVQSEYASYVERYEYDESGRVVLFGMDYEGHKNIEFKYAYEGEYVFAAQINYEKDENEEYVGTEIAKTTYKIMDKHYTTTFVGIVSEQSYTYNWVIVEQSTVTQSSKMLMKFDDKDCLSCYVTFTNNGDFDYSVTKNEYTYDSLGRLTKIKTYTGTYTPDVNGDLEKQLESVQITAETGTTELYYDDAGRVSKAKIDGYTEYTDLYTYDENGRMVEEIRDCTNLDYMDCDRQKVTYEYNENGDVEKYELYQYTGFRLFK